MTAFRIPGWITNGTIKVPADTVQAMAELVDTVRLLHTQNALLQVARDATDALLKAYMDHGDLSQEFNDAYRAAQVAVRAAK